MALSLTYGPRKEPLIGRPRTIHVFSQLSPNANDRVLQETETYRQDGQLERRSFCKDDGTVSYEWFYEYEAEGALAKVTTRDNAGNIIQTMITDRPGNGTEREIFFDGNGVETHTTTAVFDSATNVHTIEAREPTGRAIARLVIYHDRQQRPLRAQITLGESDEVEIDLDANGAPQFARQLRNTSAASGSIPEIQSLLAPAARERVELRDDLGNWIRKSILSASHDPSPEVVQVLVREITYY